jgi:hypothetical protein
VLRETAGTFRKIMDYQPVFTLAYELKNTWRFFKALQLFCTTSVPGHESISARPELLQ